MPAHAADLAIAGVGQDIVDAMQNGDSTLAFNDLMKKVQETSDPAAQAKVYGEAQKILAEDVPALYLFVMPKLGVWDKKLKGLWENEPIPSNVLTGVSWED